MRQRLSRSVITTLMWLLLAIIISAMGTMSYRACGIRILGIPVSWCQPDSVAAMGRLLALQQQIRQLETERAARLSCSEEREGLSALPNLGKDKFDDPAKRAFDADLKGLDDPKAEDMAGLPATLKPNGAGVGADGALELDAALGAGDLGGGSGSGAGGGGAMPLPPPGGAGGTGGGPGAAGAGGGIGGGGASPPGCGSGQPERPYIVLALDHSKSMGLPLDLDPSEVVRLETAIDRGGSPARQAWEEYNRYVSQPGHKRLDELKDAVAKTAEHLDPQVDIGVVTFAGCNGVLDMGDYTAERRGRMVSKVKQLRVEPATPAAQALEAAIAKASRRPNGRVIFVSDGKDTCDADPCAVARQRPDVRVDVISMGVGDVLSCVADATHGQLIRPNDIHSVEQIIADLGSVDPENGCRGAEQPEAHRSEAGN